MIDSSLLLIPLEGETQKFELGYKMLIGRDATCNIVLAGQYISRFHCTLLRQKDSEGIYHYVLWDGRPGINQSKGGTFVGGRQINNIRLSLGDVITFAKAPYPSLQFRGEDVPDIEGTGAYEIPEQSN